MKMYEINRKRMGLREKEEMELRYFITVDEIEDNEGVCCAEQYGISVEAGDDMVLIRGITPNPDKIEKLAELLVCNFVTPAGIHDVINDLVGVVI